MSLLKICFIIFNKKMFLLPKLIILTYLVLKKCTSYTFSLFSIGLLHEQNIQLGFYIWCELDVPFVQRASSNIRCRLAPALSASFVKHLSPDSIVLKKSTTKTFPQLMYFKHTRLYYNYGLECCYSFCKGLDTEQFSILSFLV